MKKLIDVVLAPPKADWSERTAEALEELFGASSGRYPQSAKNSVHLKSPVAEVSYGGLIAYKNATSGPYGGMSFVIFPIDDGPCLICMGIGTRGLNPDEEILGKPGHGRKVNAIVQYLNSKYKNHGVIGWAKSDPVRSELDMPREVKLRFPKYEHIFARYGKELYGIVAPPTPEAAEDALKLFLDLNFEERGFEPLASAKSEAEKLRSEYLGHITPKLDEEEIYRLLKQRKFLVLTGPPGTGKTFVATQILASRFAGHGETIQFHANTTYESFIGGLSPVSSADTLGFRFEPQAGALMKWIARASADPNTDYLLHVDEINRADLAKVLGEAIYLLEPTAQNRRVSLPYKFQEVGDSLGLPNNLFILGTMNSADRSIAILDIAVRRRFGFANMWPQLSVVQAHGSAIMIEAFKALYNIFINHANDESFALMPGHSYFLEADETLAVQQLRLNLIPLLREYITQGYVAGFADSIEAYIQWVNSL